MSDISLKLQACIKAMESEHSGKVEKIKQSRQRVEDLKNNMKQIVQEIKQKEDSITSAEAEVEALSSILTQTQERYAAIMKSSEELMNMVESYAPES